MKSAVVFIEDSFRLSTKQHDVLRLEEGQVREEYKKAFRKKLNMIKKVKIKIRVIDKYFRVIAQQREEGLIHLLVRTGNISKTWKLQNNVRIYS